VHLRDLCAALGLLPPTPDDTDILGAAALDEAETHHLAALFNARYSEPARTTRAGAVLVTPALAHLLPSHTVPLVSEDASRLWTLAVRCLHPGPTLRQPALGRHPSAVIDASAIVDATARVGPLCVIEAGARIDAGAVLHGGVFVGADAHIEAQAELLPRTVVMDRCRIGARTRVGPGAVIGGPGFGLDAEGAVPHIGRVLVGAEATIGANTCVDRGLVGDTIIEDRAHLDNLVQIGHGAIIGSGAVICGQVGVAGSARVEAGAVLGGQAGVADHVRIGSGVRVAAQSGVTRDLAVPGDYSGHPAEPNRERLRRIARLKRLVKS